MALLQAYTRTDGSTLRSYWRVQQGYKFVPFEHQDKLQVLPYQNSVWCVNYTNRTSGSLGYAAGAAFPGEQIPLHAAGSGISVPGVTFRPHGEYPYARAYAKFRSKAYTRADTLTAIVEREKTIAMVSNRVQQLAKGALHLRRGNFRMFLKTFGISAKPKHRSSRWSRPKDFGALWLEYWMGWAPTVGDIYNGIASIGNMAQYEPIRAGSSKPYNLYKKESIGGINASTESIWTGAVRVNISAKVRIRDDFLFKMEGLGLMNPAVTLLQVVPFSWFFGWFVNLEQVLGQITDFVGLQLDDLQVSVKTRASGGCVIQNGDTIWSGFPTTMTRSYDYVCFSRHTMPNGYLPPLGLVFSLPSRLSLSRAATSAALPIALFTPGPIKIRARL